MREFKLLYGRFGSEIEAIKVNDDCEGEEVYTFFISDNGFVFDKINGHLSEFYDHECKCEEDKCWDDAGFMHLNEETATQISFNEAMKLTNGMLPMFIDDLDIEYNDISTMN